MQPIADANLILRALIILGLIALGFYVAADQGALALALGSDKSYISHLILTLYAIACGHWLWLARQLGRERQGLADFERRLADAQGVASGGAAAKKTETGGGEAAMSAATGPQRQASAGLLRQLGDRWRQGGTEAQRQARPSLLRNLGDCWREGGAASDAAALLNAFADELANRHALGHFLSDALLKLGLLGTVVGFILMLLPIGEVEEFDPAMMQRLLTAMSSGMAVALYTTLAGLTTSTLLRLQYHILDASAAQLATRLSVIAASPDALAALAEQLDAP